MVIRTLTSIFFTFFISMGFSQIAYSDQQWESFNHNSISEFPNQPFTLDLQPLIQVADNGAPTDGTSGGITNIGTAQPSEETTIEFEESYWTPNKIHKYVGLAALSLVGVAMVAPKEEDGLHESSAKAAALLGGLAVAGGLYVHWDDVDFSEGFSDPDNLHALFAGLGAVALLFAAAEGPDGGHAGVGAVGALSMAVAVKITW
ncbi:MAG: hypothetical protein KUG67_00925 [Proteobacteria bacterium]|nr:hypothetical protein [Pseudomonadota bacterium]